MGSLREVRQIGLDQRTDWRCRHGLCHRAAGICPRSTSSLARCTIWRSSQVSLADYQYFCPAQFDALDPVRRDNGTALVKVAVNDRADAQVVSEIDQHFEAIRIRGRRLVGHMDIGALARQSVKILEEDRILLAQGNAARSAFVPRPSQVSRARG